MPTNNLQTGPERKAIEYTMRRSRRRRRTMEISVDSNGAVRVAAPNHVSLADIAAFMQARASWIEKQRKAARARQVAPHRFVDGETLLFLGRDYALRITEGLNEHANVRLAGHALTVSLPEPHNTSEAREAVMSALEAWYRAEAERLVANRMLHYQQRVGVRPKALRMSNARTRWGSCGTRGAIRISWRLIMAPVSLIDYVIVHELCHLRHPNHGRRFWRLVESILPTYKSRRGHLRREGGRYTI